MNKNTLNTYNDVRAYQKITSQDEDQQNSNVSVLIKPKVQKPNQYQVLLLNDDYTPMDFVVQVLMMFFHKTTEDAVQLMFQVHNEGKAVCGIYPYEIAETKVAQVMLLAQQQEHPLRCTLEKKP